MSARGLNPSDDRRRDRPAKPDDRRRADRHAAGAARPAAAADGHRRRAARGSPRISASSSSPTAADGSAHPAARRRPGRTRQRRTTTRASISTTVPPAASRSISCPTPTRSTRAKAVRAEVAAARRGAFRRACATISRSTPPPSSRPRSTRSIGRCSRPARWCSSSFSSSCTTGAPTLVPATTVPVTIVGAFAAMAALGFSINLLTLFALVLCIGIVVDDAIVVVEGVAGHIEKGNGAARGGRDRGDARADRPDHRHHAGAGLGVPAGGLHSRHHRPDVPAVRARDRRDRGAVRRSTRSR